LLGGLTRTSSFIRNPTPVVCEITEKQTARYLLGKDGIHTPAHLPHGLRSVEES